MCKHYPIYLIQYSTYPALFFYIINAIVCYYKFIILMYSFSLIFVMILYVLLICIHLSYINFLPTYVFLLSQLYIYTFDFFSISWTFVVPAVDHMNMNKWMNEWMSVILWAERVGHRVPGRKLVSFTTNFYAKITSCRQTSRHMKGYSWTDYQCHVAWTLLLLPSHNLLRSCYILFPTHNPQK